ncbi:ABC transporter substrate-binding protein [Acuticoccus kandeliae]|uniref:ABC transporter substrate-binding protein n=1 Tax=Acuticoccus kandeliae TaxID=2073160 RepID=UPI001300B4A7|nr:extracellular solute-binding protein [Acuticoccus kandeliae]
MKKRLIGSAGSMARPASRRTVLKGMGAAGLAGAASLSMPSIVRAQDKTVQFWTTQRGPTQQPVYEEIWKAFEAANPGVTVAIQYTTEEEYLPKLTAALASGNAPNLMSHMPPEFAVALNERDLCAPMDPVIDAVGKDDFFANSRELLFDAEKGFFPAISIVNSTTTGALWYRKDLLEKAGVGVPTNWEEYLAAAKAMTGRGFFGNVYPFGKTSMGDKLFLQTIWQGGGFVFDPDLTITFNSDENAATLEFIQEVVQYSPPSSATYAYAETINAFVQGRIGMAPYSGRVLSTMASSNPNLADQISVTGWPQKPGAREVYNGDFQSLVMPAAAADQEMSQKMALWLFQPDNYIKFLHAVPGHNLPNLKSIAESPEYQNDPLLQKYATESQTLVDLTSKSRSFLKETEAHKINKKAGSIYNSRILVETVHDVIVGGIAPKDALSRATDKIAAVMQS